VGHSGKCASTDNFDAHRWSFMMTSSSAWLPTMNA
jgi:hypothetical protein